MSEIEKEIQDHLKGIEKLKKLIPLGVLITFGFGFLFPIFPARNGTLKKWIGYPYAAAVCFVFAALVYFLSYKTAVKRRKEAISKLQEKMENMS